MTRPSTALNLTLYEQLAPLPTLGASSLITVFAGPITLFFHCKKRSGEVGKQVGQPLRLCLEVGDGILLAF
jgi:hypothetical protein